MVSLLTSFANFKSNKKSDNEGEGEYSEYSEEIDLINKSNARKNKLNAYIGVHLKGMVYIFC